MDGAQRLSPNTQKQGRRRRSSSLIYQEPPESIEHTSDQAALPNLNANWVNAKGKSRFPKLSYLFSHISPVNSSHRALSESKQSKLIQNAIFYEQGPGLSTSFASLR